MDRIYTKIGDKGFTKLGTGASVSKTDQRVEAFGTVDELSSFLGLALATCEKPELDRDLIWIQRKLFTIASILAFPGSTDGEELGNLTEGDVKTLEEAIDELSEETPPLTKFILPGGGLSGALLHCSRSICRRAERKVAELDMDDYPLGSQILPFLNRLSDYLFVLARLVNYRTNSPELNAKTD